MLKEVAVAFAYMKAPRVTFALLHPRTAIRLKTFSWAFRRVRSGRVAGIAAAAVAVPVGIWATRQLTADGRRS